ncbi:MAG TPA: heparan-alpha-glucosaminide N-acetyltransferase domain-containing protein [Ignavibacteriaceae bacterium]|nr:heparan-alpha-glucosaminide N-acetyltransferase domain-containing protein [Ignavibacteriaceae bacterium]
MVTTGKKNRIIFIDLMRAFAVIQMVQGHTVDVLLAPELRTDENLAYSIWLFMRGMTAPIFMFTAGTTFTYLFRLAQKPFEKNPRVWKGFKRFALLLFIGYMLRYPTFTLIDFSSVTDSQWRIFFAVDVLHLIGFGILFVLMLAYLSEKSKLGDYVVFIAAALIFFLPADAFQKIGWTNYLPHPIASYFYTGTGSQFPLFPWAGYVLLGGALGSFLAKNPMVFKSPKFSFILSVIGFILLFLSYIGGDLANFFGYSLDRSSTSLLTISFRVGFVLLLNALVSFISISVETIPRIIILVGRNTLLIYVIHLMILYGSAWNRGINHYWGKSLYAPQTISIALAMIVTMTTMVWVINKLRIRNKELVT